MTFTIVYTATAQGHLHTCYRWLYAHSPSGADRWREGVIAAVESLQEYPYRHGLAEEGRAFGREIHQLVYGRRRGLYRILYDIDGQTVRVLAIRHGMQDWLTKQEIE